MRASLRSDASAGSSPCRLVPQAQGLVCAALKAGLGITLLPFPRNLIQVSGFTAAGTRGPVLGGIVGRVIAGHGCTVVDLLNRPSLKRCRHACRANRPVRLICPQRCRHIERLPAVARCRFIHGSLIGLSCPLTIGGIGDGAPSRLRTDGHDRGSGRLSTPARCQIGNGPRTGPGSLRSNRADRLNRLTTGCDGRTHETPRSRHACHAVTLTY